MWGIVAFWLERCQAHLMHRWNGPWTHSFLNFRQAKEQTDELVASLQRPPLPAASSSASFNESLEDPTKSLQLTLGSSKPLLSTGLSLKSSLDLECAARPEEPVSQYNELYILDNCNKFKSFIYISLFFYNLVSKAICSDSTDFCLQIFVYNCVFWRKEK